MFERLFKIKERKTTILKEILAGLIIFATVLYALPANAGVLSIIGVDFEGNFAVSAFACAGICIAMGLISNHPLADVPAMGINIILAVTISQIFGFSWQECFLIVTIVGALMLIVSITSIRDKIVNGIPKDLKVLLSVGIGFFLGIIGLANSGIVVFNSGLPALGDLTKPDVLIPFIGAIIGILLVFVKNKIISSLAIPITLIICTIVSLSVNYGIYGGSAANLATFSDSWGVHNMEEVVLFGYFGSQAPDISFFEMLGNIFTNPLGYVSIITLFLVSLFNSSSVLITTAANAKLVNKDGTIQNFKRVVTIDSAGNIAAGLVGTSIMIPVAESNVGISFGGRTGLTSVVVGILFAISAFIYPIFSIFASWSVVGPILIVVGSTIVGGCLKDLNLKDYRIGILTFVLIIFLLLTYSIVYGFGLTVILYVLINLITGRKDENSIEMYILAAVFVAMFVLDAITRLI